MDIVEPKDIDHANFLAAIHRDFQLARHRCVVLVGCQYFDLDGSRGIEVLPRLRQHLVDAHRGDLPVAKTYRIRKHGREGLKIPSLVGPHVCDKRRQVVHRHTASLYLSRARDCIVTRYRRLGCASDSSDFMAAKAPSSKVRAAAD